MVAGAEHTEHFSPGHPFDALNLSSTDPLIRSIGHRALIHELIDPAEFPETPEMIDFGVLKAFSITAEEPWRTLGEGPDIESGEVYLDIHLSPITHLNDKRGVVRGGLLAMAAYVEEKDVDYVVGFTYPAIADRAVFDYGFRRTGIDPEIWQQTILTHLWAQENIDEALGAPGRISHRYLHTTMVWLNGEDFVERMGDLS